MIKMKKVIVLLQFVFLVCSVSAGPIHEAAWKGNLTAVKAELDKGVNVNAKGTDGMTALHYAAKNGYVSIASLLIDKGADIEIIRIDGDDHARRALHYAIEENDKNMVDLLIKKGADVDLRTSDMIFDKLFRKYFSYEDLTTLDFAAMRRIDSGPNVDSKKERRINSDIITILKENGGSWDSIQTAVAGGDLAYVNQFLDEGGWVETVDVNDSTLLWLAAVAGQYEMVK